MQPPSQVLDNTSRQQNELDEEYMLAQRAAYESILIGRATAEVVHQQGEQLSRAENLIDDTQTFENEKKWKFEITDDIVRTAAVGLPPNWEALLSEEHVPYYANTVTGEVQWEPPEK